MSEQERSPASLALDQLVQEAREHLDVHESGSTEGARNDAHDVAQNITENINWERLEARVLAAVEEDVRKDGVLEDVKEASGARPRPRRLSSPPSRWKRQLVTSIPVLLAAAAAVVVVVRKEPPPPTSEQASSTEATMTSSSLRSTEGDGEVRINEVVASPGYVVREGDAIDVTGARAVFERPRKVTWLIEQDVTRVGESDQTSRAARAHVNLTGEPFVLGLEHGSIEAQVAPVPVGEAFAVDLETEHGLVRVAVHGTHLRVTRTGNHVSVDLSEGVVAIGVPPRTGVTTGTVVTAPAHVELDATDLRTLEVDHTAASVRPAIPLGIARSFEGPPFGQLPGRPIVGRAEPVVPPALTLPASPSTMAVKENAPRWLETPSGKLEHPKPSVAPRETIASAVRDCATARSRSGDVHVTVTSNLQLQVSPTGEVTSAQFSPPLLPDIQTCAAQVIYKTRLAESGSVTIPIEFSY